MHHLNGFSPHKYEPALNERDKNLFLLLSILFHNLIYPMSTGDGWHPIFFYMVFCSIFVIGVYTLTTHQWERIVVVISSIVVFFAGLINSYTPGTFAMPVLYTFGTIYHLTMLIVLVRYIFEAKRILIEVILAAASLYLVIGSTFTAIYGLIEYLEPGSFAVASGTALGWQQLLYYSYVTLTTLGYGDITPVKSFAQSLSSFEAVIGVLYTVILLPRFITLYEVADRIHDDA
ncbi:two pore domain potassium channel family protein [Phototrophicus methaneseepsis]|uniref:Two pore domain potassium channel family protein n=1 Tax=Phototrophicus methaneseepsis TaxID=2710758 RepID=A0A7S8E9A4_9CHLR|nr:potassium channel family protein [Phototrophicus methaneseepsis]QPC82609.1 two pore domain potassium channel family protein [Phototrophicus methaneseepsis]